MFLLPPPLSPPYQIDAAFVAQELGIVDNLEQSGPDIQGCLVDGTALMTRKGSALPSWFNPALQRLLSTRDYEQICDDIVDVHGMLIHVVETVLGPYAQSMLDQV